MTSATESLTPETLSALAEALLGLHDTGLDRDFVPTQSRDVSRDAASEQLKAHADAWDADKARLEAAEQLAEAAGKLLAAEVSRVMGYPQTYRGEIDALRVALSNWAGLAREETPHE